MIIVQICALMLLAVVICSTVFIVLRDWTDGLTDTVVGVLIITSLAIAEYTMYLDVMRRLAE